MVVISVPHNGTRFTMKVLEDAGIEVTQKHFTHDLADSGLYPEDFPAVIPIRYRDSVEASWERRKKFMPNLDECYAEMDRYLARFPHFLYRIEDEELRDADLKAISDYLGVPLIADYSEKVGHGM